MPFLKKVHSSPASPAKRGEWFVVHGHKKTINHQPSTINRNSTGFTLIELLVVIAIIGILAALATVSFADSQQKSRDSRRKSDLEAIRKAMELAKQDSAGSYSYPTCDGAVALCALTSTNTTPDLVPASGTPYIKSVPTDPKSSTAYTYSTFASDGTTACSSAGTCVRFTLVACLENRKDQQRDPAASQNTAVCGVLATTNTPSYTISNL